MVLRVLGAFIASEVVLVGSAILWVAVWAVFLNRSASPAEVEAYAQVASPWVSVVVGLPVFAVLGALLRRREVAWLLGIYLTFDIVVVLGFTDDIPTSLMFFVLSGSTKVGAAALANLWRSRRQSDSSTSTG